MNKEDRLDAWILLVINRHTRGGGIIITELVSKSNRRLEADFGDISARVNKLVKAGFLKEEPGPHSLSWSFYTITVEGKEKLDKFLKKFGNKEFFDLIEISPPEIGLNYRLYNLENMVLWLLLGWMLFTIALFLIKRNYVLISFLFLLLSFLSLAAGIGFLSLVITPRIVRIIEKIFEKFSKWDPINKWALKNKRLLYEFGRAFFVGIVLGTLASLLLIIGLYLYLRFPDETIFWIATSFFAVILALCWKIIYKFIVEPILSATAKDKINVPQSEEK